MGTGCSEPRQSPEAKNSEEVKGTGRVTLWRLLGVPDPRYWSPLAFLSPSSWSSLDEQQPMILFEQPPSPLLPGLALPLAVLPSSSNLG